MSPFLFNETVVSIIASRIARGENEAQVSQRMRELKPKLEGGEKENISGSLHPHKKEKLENYDT